jgi:FkbM family methyltransferase
LAGGLRERIAARAFELRLRRLAAGDDLVQLGSGYGGWAVPRGLDPSWTCYAAGVGEDASFDVALAEIGCEVVAIDPTPRALDYMKPIVARHERLSLVPYAVWTEEGELDFFPPADPAHVSYSATNRQHTADPIRVPARTLAGIARELGHERVDLVKLDIEGAEYPVLDSLDLGSLGVRVLCVEFHPDPGLRRMLATVRAVMRHGYEVAAVDRTDVTFIRRDRP